MGQVPSSLCTAARFWWWQSWAPLEVSRARTKGSNNQKNTSSETRPIKVLSWGCDQWDFPGTAGYTSPSITPNKDPSQWEVQSPAGSYQGGRRVTACCQHSKVLQLPSSRITGRQQHQLLIKHPGQPRAASPCSGFKCDLHIGSESWNLITALCCTSLSSEVLPPQLGTASGMGNHPFHPHGTSRSTAHWDAAPVRPRKPHKACKALEESPDTTPNKREERWALHKAWQDPNALNFFRYIYLIISFHIISAYKVQV